MQQPSARASASATIVDGRERSLERARVEPVGGRDVVHPEQDRARLGCRRAEPADRRDPAACDRERQVLLMLPGIQVRGRVDSTVVAEVQERHRMDLEVEVVRRSLGVAGVAHEADDLSRLHVRAVHRVDRERREVRVVELVARLVDDPEAVAADLVEADGEDDAVGARDERLPERSEDVVAMVIGDVRSLRAKRVDVRRRPVDREDVAAGGELRLHVSGCGLGLAAASRA